MNSLAPSFPLNQRGRRCLDLKEQIHIKGRTLCHLLMKFLLGSWKDQLQSWRLRLGSGAGGEQPGYGDLLVHHQHSLSSPL